MAYEFGKEFSKPSFTINPTNVDEYDDEARITGLKGVYRRAQSHVLNQKGIARLHAAKLGKRYEDSLFIVCHIDGGITIAAHKYGKMIDGTEGAGGDGPGQRAQTPVHSPTGAPVGDAGPHRPGHQEPGAAGAV